MLHAIILLNWTMEQIQNTSPLLYRFRWNGNLAFVIFVYNLINILYNCQIDSSIRKLIKSDRDLHDSLVAAIIRNLKIVKVCIFSWVAAIMSLNKIQHSFLLFSLHKLWSAIMKLKENIDDCQGQNINLKAKAIKWRLVLTMTKH